MNIKENRSLIIMFTLSIALMFAAIFTATNSFAMPNELVDEVKWEIKYGEIVAKDKSYEDNIDVIDNNIDFKVLLKEYGDRFDFSTDIINSGSFDAYLTSIKLTDLSKIIVGKSNTTNKTYYVSDYISYTVNYSNNNKDNNVIVGAKVGVGDLLLSGTKNKISITVQYKDQLDLTEDQINVLKENLVKTVIDQKEYLAFQLDLNLNTIYQQLK